MFIAKNDKDDNNDILVTVSIFRDRLLLTVGRERIKFLGLGLSSGATHTFRFSVRWSII